MRIYKIRISLSYCLSEKVSLGPVMENPYSVMLGFIMWSGLTSTFLNCESSRFRRSRNSRCIFVINIRLRMRRVSKRSFPICTKVGFCIPTPTCLTMDQGPSSRFCSVI
ncbi:hypothetical protein [African swine fever virus]|uniref:Uncharacterized protein n=1 Tax=African swine fever virus TaxID=10497 RepID=A0A3G1EV45_ASF|nr:hypothetical protein F8221_gp135 [African swine fever virus]AOO54440.1 hypothetical protein AFSV47Ss_0135 [African swine fever virus]QIM06776.1 hypothetical protein [African swine fever virus]QIM07011.1 hypothetical protein [African swine fever virus]QIM07246.1 hypothetical protein [African swine fever virus]QIM07481.1 hypothetical protein [African swine fever virus]